MSGRTQQFELLLTLRADLFDPNDEGEDLAQSLDAFDPDGLRCDDADGVKRDRRGGTFGFSERMGRDERSGEVRVPTTSER